MQSGSGRGKGPGGSARCRGSGGGKHGKGPAELAMRHMTEYQLLGGGKESLLGRLVTTPEGERTPKVVVPKP